MDISKGMLHPEDQVPARREVSHLSGAIMLVGGLVCLIAGIAILGDASALHAEEELSLLDRDDWGAFFLLAGALQAGLAVGVWLIHRVAMVLSAVLCLFILLACALAAPLLPGAALALALWQILALIVVSFFLTVGRQV